MLTDIDYQPAPDDELVAFAAESGVPLPEGVVIHRGFLQAWRSVREGVLSAIDELLFHSAPSLRPPRKLSLRVTGHSMGGACGQHSAHRTPTSARSRRDLGAIWAKS